MSAVKPQINFVLNWRENNNLHACLTLNVSNKILCFQFFQNKKIVSLNER